MSLPCTAPETNFGGNIRFAPQWFYTPKNEEELLEILQRHAGKEIRVIGRLHCWGDLLRSDGVMLDLRLLDTVVVHRDMAPPVAEVGAGCQIKRLLTELRRHGMTTLSQGLIKEQAIAGASATGTHGSGGHSFSHYLQAVRVAHYRGEDGAPCLDDINDGPNLRAARCSLGALGVVTRVRIAIRPAYQVEEHFRNYKTVEDVLQQETEFPLQQFFFVPWRWDFFAQHRREVTVPQSWTVPLYRLYWSLGMDRVFHWTIIALARALPAGWTKFFFRRVLAWLVPQGWKVVDRSDRQLSMGHELFRHIETELFVTRADLPAALSFVKTCLQHAAGETVALDEGTMRQITAAGLRSEWDALQSKYLHHYPICVRQVLADDTLVSMASGSEPRYALSIVSYARVDERDGFFSVTKFLTSALARLFDARPHWGKYCPITAEDVTAVYPLLPEFRAIAASFDPHHHFSNPWVRTTLLASPAVPSRDRPI